MVKGQREGYYMITHSSIAPQRCWVSDGKRGLGKHGMKDLSSARKSGMSTTEFIQSLKPVRPDDATNMLEAREWQSWDEEAEDSIANDYSRYDHSPSAAFAAIQYHMGGFKVTNRP